MEGTGRYSHLDCTAKVLSSCLGIGSIWSCNVAKSYGRFTGLMDCSNFISNGAGVNLVQLYRVHKVFSRVCISILSLLISRSQGLFQPMHLHSLHVTRRGENTSFGLICG